MSKEFGALPTSSIASVDVLLSAALHHQFSSRCPLFYWPSPHGHPLNPNVRADTHTYHLASTYLHLQISIDVTALRSLS